MIARATAINLISRNIGRLYNTVEPGGKPGISFAMTERKRREIAKLIENQQHLPTCMGTSGYRYPAGHGRAGMTFASCGLSNGRITGRRNKGRKRLDK